MAQEDPVEAPGDPVEEHGCEGEQVHGVEDLEEVRVVEVGGGGGGGDLVVEGWASSDL